MSAKTKPRVNKLVAEAHALGKEYNELTRESVRAAWEIGCKLEELRTILSAEDYLHVVNEEMPFGVSGVTAVRFQQLWKAFAAAADSRRG